MGVVADKSVVVMRTTQRAHGISRPLPYRVFDGPMAQAKTWCAGLNKRSTSTVYEPVYVAKEEPPLAEKVTPGDVKAHRLLDMAAKAWYEYAGSVDVGVARIQAFEIYERVLNARRIR